MYTTPTFIHHFNSQSVLSRSVGANSFTETRDGAREVIRDSAILTSDVLIAWNEKSSSPTKLFTCL